MLHIQIWNNHNKYNIHDECGCIKLSFIDVELIHGTECDRNRDREREREST